MSSSTEIPRPSIKTIAIQLATTVRAKLVVCVEKFKQKREESNKFARNPNQELANFGSFNQESVDCGGGEGEFGSGDKITEWQAGWNVTNAIQGMFIVSLPFAVLHGGYWAIAAMIGVAYICCYTGKILVECLYEPDANGVNVRVRESYVQIAKECFGKKYGPIIVNTAQIIELLMTCILYIVLCGDLMIGTFPDWPIDSRSWMMLSGIIILPVAFLKNLHHVSTFSFWCTVAHLLVNFVIVAYTLSCIGQWAPSEVNLTIDMDTFPISLGIIVFSYTSHIFLPTLEGNMQDPAQFNNMLDWSHIAAAAFKSGFGYLAFLTWQKSTLQVITNNLPTVWKSLVNIILVMKAVLSFPLPYYAAVELLERIFVPKRKYGELIWDKWGDLTNVGCMSRVGVVVICVLSAVSIPHFGILMGFIGNFTGTMLSFIWPCYFHLKLKGNSLHWKVVCWDCFIIFLGFMFAIVGIYDSGNAMIEAYQIGLPF